MNIKKFIEEQESIGNFLINTRQWAMDKADKKFKEEYEDLLPWPTIYEQPDKENKPDLWLLNEKYSDIYFAMVDTFEEELEEYKSDIYES